MTTKARGRSLAMGLLGSAVVASSCVLWVRPWFLNWGTTAEEAARPLAGDNVIENPLSQSTRAITIDAPPSVVWPWLVQLGQGRAGYYSYDFLENLLGADIHSIDRIVPELQKLQVGDYIQAAPEPYLGFEVVGMDQPRTMVTRATIDMFTGLKIRPGEPLPSHYFDGTWAFQLEETGQGATRLLVRLRAQYQAGIVQSSLVRLILEPSHFVMERKMLKGIKERAERNARFGI